jgi:hypothetical protein
MVEDFFLKTFGVKKLQKMRKNKNKNWILVHMFPDLLGEKLPNFPHKIAQKISPHFFLDFRLKAFFLLAFF